VLADDRRRAKLAARRNAGQAKALIDDHLRRRSPGPPGHEGDELGLGPGRGRGARHIDPLAARGDPDVLEAQDLSRAKLLDPPGAVERKVRSRDEHSRKPL
jgi:hypothetical protein